MGQLVWVHQWIAEIGVLDRLLSGDTSVCAIIGTMVGCIVGWQQLTDRSGERNR